MIKVYNELKTWSYETHPIFKWPQHTVKSSHFGTEQPPVIDDQCSQCTHVHTSWPRSVEFKSGQEAAKGFVENLVWFLLEMAFLNFKVLHNQRWGQGDSAL